DPTTIISLICSVVCCGCSLLVCGAIGYAIYYLKTKFTDFWSDPFGFIWALIKYILHLPESYDNGLGKPLQCSSNEHQVGILCYPKCPDGSSELSGFASTDLNCWKNCPAGSTPNAIVPTCESHECPSGQTDHAGSCY